MLTTFKAKTLPRQEDDFVGSTPKVHHINAKANAEAARHTALLLQHIMVLQMLATRPGATCCITYLARLPGMLIHLILLDPARCVPEWLDG